MIKHNPLFRSGNGVSQAQPLSHTIQLPGARLQEDCGSAPSPPPNSVLPFSISPSWGCQHTYFTLTQPLYPSCTSLSSVPHSLHQALLHYSPSISLSPPPSLSGDTSAVLCCDIEAAFIRFIKCRGGGAFFFSCTQRGSGRCAALG